MTERSTPLDWRESLEARNFEQAAARLQALQLVNQGDPTALASVEAMVEYQKAIRSKQYAKAAKLVPQLSGIANGVAAGLDLSQLTAATQNLLQLEQHEPKEPEAYQQAIAAALENPYTRAEALNRLAVLHVQRGDAVQARVLLEQAIVADAKHYRAISNLGNIALEAGNLKEAEGLYRQALEINPEYPLAHNNLAVLLRKQKRLGESIKRLKTSHRLEQKSFRDQAREEARSKQGGLKPSMLLMYGVVALVVLWLLFMR